MIIKQKLTTAVDNGSPSFSSGTAPLPREAWATAKELNKARKAVRIEALIFHFCGNNEKNNIMPDYAL
jgi:hypothetical protein